MNARTLRSGILLAAAIATAVGIVYARHQGRKQFVELRELQAHRDELNVEWGRLQLEQATWADASRVERVARDELGLVSREPSQVVVIVR